MEYIAIPLEAIHNRSSFTCGENNLDNYIQKQATQDMKRRHVAVVFVLPDESNNIKGYYTLSSDNVAHRKVPVEVQKKMPHYKNLPVILLGRLAIDKKYQGDGLGELLLLDALKRSYDVAKTTIGSIAVVVDPLNNEAVSFYKKYGFISLADSKRRFLPMQTIKQLFATQ
jgi:GNAT superfamily N-acetyltransferase